MKENKQNQKPISKIVEIERKCMTLTHIYMTAQSPDLYNNFNKNWRD